MQDLRHLLNSSNKLNFIEEPMITYAEYEKIELLCNEMYNTNGLRYGQSLMNALHHVRPELYNEVAGCNFRDCFYDDNKVTNLLNYLIGRPWKTQD